MPNLESKAYWSPSSIKRDNLVVQGLPAVGVNGLRSTLLENTPGYPLDRIQSTESFIRHVETSLTDLLTNGGGIMNTGGNIFADSFENLGLNEDGETVLLKETVIEGKIVNLQAQYGLDAANFGLNIQNHAYLIASGANSKIARIDTRGGSAIFYICRADGSNKTIGDGSDFKGSIHQLFWLFAKATEEEFFPEEDMFPLVASRSLVNAILYDLSLPAEPEG